MSLLTFGKRKTAPIAATAVANLLTYWDPLNIATLFQEIAGTTPVASNGQNVGHMTGLINAVASADDTTRPTYSAAGLNGRAGILYTAASLQRLTANAIATGTLTGDDKPHTTIIVVQPTTLDASRQIWTMRAAASTDPIVGLRTDAGDTLRGQRRATAAGGQKDVASTALLTEGAATVVAHRFNGTQGDLWMWQGGVAVQLALFTDQDVLTLTVDNFVLGAFITTTVGAHWNGLMGRFAVYSRSLETFEVAGVMRNFATAHGIP